MSDKSEGSVLKYLQQIDQRICQMDHRMEQIEARLGAVEAELATARQDIVALVKANSWFHQGVH